MQLLLVSKNVFLKAYTSNSNLKLYKCIKIDNSISIVGNFVITVVFYCS